MLVMKFGGASVAGPENFSKIADLICDKARASSQIVVVVSAMGRTTDQLLELAYKVHPNPPSRELDMMVSVGERVSIALLAMALSLKGKEAVSFTGSQSGIITCNNHTAAKIIDVRPSRLKSALDQGKIVIVAGFQGVSSQGEITTLGRGGSDTTAVALGIALGASEVEFYKDVPGIFDRDPKCNSHAKLLPFLSFDEAMDLCLKGAKVLHSRSIALASQNGMKLVVRSFESPSQLGTVVGREAKRAINKIYEIDKV
jgi:aspartate kinase